MAKDRKKLQHIHSSIPDKQPTAASLEVGEIAVNNAKDQEFLSLKNSENKVVRFSSDEQIVTIMEKKGVMPYSGTVDNVHLDTNRSNIEIKLNQVVAKNTVKHELVNGAKDIDGNYVNPTTDGGLTNGAGFAIDMSLYAMQGANPSFSSITSTNRSDLNGVTNINGTNTISGTTNIKGTTLDVDTNTTNVKSCEQVKLESRNIILTDGTCGDGEVTVSTNDLCLAGDNKASLYGKETNVGIDCDGNSSANTVNIYGRTIVEKATTADTEILSSNTVISTANTVISVANTTATTVNNSGVTENNAFNTINNNVTNFNVVGTTNITGNTNLNGDTHIYSALTIDGNTTVKGNTYLSGKTYFNNTCSSVTANELGEALCEIMSRSDVTIERDSNPSDSGLSAVYKLYQNGRQITNEQGAPIDINIPKDGFLKSAELVKINDTFYLRFIWNIYDADTQTYSTASTDVNVEDLVKDIDENNTNSNRGVDVNVWYNETDKKMNVSATTNFSTYSTNGNHAVEVKNGGIYESGTTLNFESGNFADTTNKKYEPWSTSNTVKIPTDVAHLNRGVLTIQKNGVTVNTFDPSTNSTINIEVPAIPTIPSSVCELSRGSLTFEHNNKSVNYDPCSGTNVGVLEHEQLTLTYGKTSDKSGTVTYDTAADKSVNIPTDVSHLNRGVLTIQKNGVTVNTFDPAADNTINIEVPAIPTIPSSVCELQRGALTIKKNGTAIGTYDPCSANTINIEVPSAVTSVSQLERGTLSFRHNGTNVSYDGGADAAIGDLTHGLLTLSYGKSSDKSGIVNYDTSASSSVTIPTDVSHLNRGKLTITQNGVTVDTFDPSTDKTINITVPSTPTVPTSVCELQRGTLTIQKNGTSIGTYDPCSANTINIEVPTIPTIPTSVCDLNPGTLSFEHNGKSVQYDACTDKAMGTLTHETLTIAYGKTSDKSGIVTYDTAADKAINIPTDVSHLNRGILTVQKNGLLVDTFDPSYDHTINIQVPDAVTSVCELQRGSLTIQKNGVDVGTYDPCSGKTIDIKVPTDIGDLNNRGILTLTQGGTTLGTYDPSSASTINIPAGGSSIECINDIAKRYTLKLEEGAFSATTEKTYDPGKTCASGTTTVYIPSEVSHLKRGKLTLTQGSTTLGEYDPSTDNTINIPSAAGGGITCDDLRELKLSGSTKQETYHPCTGATIEVKDFVVKQQDGTVKSTYSPLSGNDLTVYDLKIKQDGVLKATYNPISGYAEVDITGGGGGGLSCNQLPKIAFTSGATSAYTYDPCGNDLNIPFKDLIITQSGITRGTYNPLYGATIEVPGGGGGGGSVACINDIVNRYTLELEAGAFTASTATTYDPGKTCSTGVTTVKIPTSLDHLTEYNGSCYEFEHDICMSGNTIAAKAFYTKSDRNLKENIQSLLDMDAKKSDNVSFKSFNFKSDEAKAKTYGVIAQDVQEAGLSEIVHVDENGTLSVDYTSLFILKIASLESKINELQEEIKNLKKDNN